MMKIGESTTSAARKHSRSFTSRTPAEEGH